MKTDLFVLDAARLDEYWLEQPLLVKEAGEKLAEAKQVLDKAKAQLDLTASEVTLDLRKNPEKTGLGKLTEGALKDYVTTSDAYQEAHNDVIEAQHEVNILSTYMAALDHRKKALENLVSLHGQSYFAKPVAKTEDGKAAMDTVVKKRIRRPKKKSNR